MPDIQDSEFGTISVRKSAKSSAVRIRVAPNGTLRATLPLYTPTLFVKRLINSSRDELRALLKETQPDTLYQDGMQIGKSHTLLIRRGTHRSVKRSGLQITMTLAVDDTVDQTDITNLIREQVIRALRIEAKSYLPKRLKFLADKHGFYFERARFSHASGRWGSCSSTGTISLNIALMKLPFELIDYVIIHELSHTVHMNHSDAFWALVEAHDPNYKIHRKRLKLERPHI